jgi:hypothetical protein
MSGLHGSKQTMGFEKFTNIIREKISRKETRCKK